VRQRFLIIHNPGAGSGRDDLLDDAITHLQTTGARVTRREAHGEAMGWRMADEAARSGAYDAIVAAGGDGTIRDVAAGVRGTKVPAGIVHLGSGNVMAHEIGLGRAPEAAARCLLNAAAKPVRGALANETPFFLMAGAGLDADVVASLNLPLKRRIGKLAYVWPVVRAIFRPAPRIRAQLDGESYEGRWVVACKAGRYAGGFMLSPDSRLFTPGLTAVICTARSPLTLILNILMIGAGQAHRAPHLRFVPFRAAQISADRRVPAQVDGESFGTLPLTICEDHISASLLAPRPPVNAPAERAKAAA
jgi:diacylglycerol kinase (ATP)